MNGKSKANLQKKINQRKQYHMERIEITLKRCKRFLKHLKESWVLVGKKNHHLLRIKNQKVQKEIESIHIFVKFMKMRRLFIFVYAVISWFVHSALYMDHTSSMKFTLLRNLPNFYAKIWHTVQTHLRRCWLKNNQNKRY